MSIEIVFESDARRACVEKLLRIEEAMKLLSPLVRAVPFRAPPRIATVTDLPRGRWAPTWSAVASMCVLALSMLILAATIVVCWGRP